MHRPAKASKCARWPFSKGSAGLAKLRDFDCKNAKGPRLNDPGLSYINASASKPPLAGLIEETLATESIPIGYLGWFRFFGRFGQVMQSIFAAILSPFLFPHLISQTLDAKASATHWA
jgi:hypothetical protein